MPETVSRSSPGVVASTSRQLLRVADDKIVVARGEYHIRNARKSGDAGCADMLRGLATEEDFLTMRTQSAVNTRKRTEQKRQRERKREEQLAKQRELFVTAHDCSRVAASLGVLPRPLVAGCPHGIRSAHDRRRVTGSGRSSTQSRARTFREATRKQCHDQSSSPGAGRRTTIRSRSICARRGQHDQG
jgi:hypothetical protein